MVVIRLSRCGQRHKPKYRVTVADSRRSARGRFIKIIGHYDGLAKDKQKGFYVDQEQYKTWVSKGARPSQRVLSLMQKYVFKSEIKGEDGKKSLSRKPKVPSQAKKPKKSKKSKKKTSQPVSE